MLRGPVGRRALGSFPVAGALLGFSPVGAHASSYDEAIARALRLLPRQPEKIVLVERPNATGPHEGKPNAEEQLWKEFILTQRVDSRQGMRYLALLRNRR